MKQSNTEVVNLSNTAYKPGFKEVFALLACSLFAASIALKQQVNNALLIASFASALLAFNVANFRKLSAYILVFAAYSAYSFLSYYWSVDAAEGAKVMERQLALLFAPVVLLPLFYRYKQITKYLPLVFLLGMVGVSVYLLSNFMTGFLAEKKVLSEFTVKEHLYHAFAGAIGMHATYLSIFVGFAIVCVLSLFLKALGFVKNVLLTICLAILVVTLSLLASRVVMGTLAIIVLFIYPFFIKGIKGKIILGIAGLGIVFTLVFFVTESKFISTRFVDKLDDEIKLSGFRNPDTTYNPIYGGETRADRWYCAFEQISEHPLIGTGIGSEKSELMKRYQKYNLQNAVINGYDAHNQYLAYAIKGGLIGTLLFLLAVFMGFRLAFKVRSFMYLAFMILVAAACLTENYLESNKGIVFYAVFNSLLAAAAISSLEKEKEDRNKQAL